MKKNKTIQPKMKVIISTRDIVQILLLLFVASILLYVDYFSNKAHSQIKDLTQYEQTVTETAAHFDENYNNDYSYNTNNNK